MTTAELINRIVSKFGGNRVRFLEIDPNGVRFQLGGYRYFVQCDQDSVIVTLCDAGMDSYRNWVHGVLNGGVRNDAGEITIPA